MTSSVGDFEVIAADSKSALVDVEEEDLQQPLLSARTGTRPSLGDFIIPFIAPFFMVPYCVFYSGVVFAGDIHSAGFTHGYILLLFTAALNSTVFSFLSQMPLKVAGPDSTGAFFFCRMVANIRLGLVGPDLSVTPSSTDVAQHMMVAMVVFSILQGWILIMLTFLRMAFLIQFIPYQVAAGFIAGGGMLTLISSINLASGLTSITGVMKMLLRLVGWMSLPDAGHASWVPVSQAALCLTFGAALWQVKQATHHHPATVPVFIMVTCAIFYAIAIPLLGGRAGVNTAGWTIEELADTKLHVQDEISAFWAPIIQDRIYWSVVFSPDNFREFISMSVVLLLNWSFNMLGTAKGAGVSSALDPTKELIGLGITNVVGSVLGGVASCHNYAIAVLGRQVGVSSSVAPTLVVLVFWLLLLTPTLVGVIPRFVIGGLLCCLGIETLQEWIVRAKSRIAQNEWYIVLTIGFCMVYIDLAMGVIIGLILSLLFCAVEYNAVTGIVAEDTCGSAWSHVERPVEQRKHLMQHGHMARVFWLEGYLFFGSAFAVLATLKESLTASPAQYCIIDLSRVPAVDASGVQSLVDFASALKAKLILCGMVRRLRLAIGNAAKHAEAAAVAGQPPLFEIFSDLDAALEYAEDKILGRFMDTKAESIQVRQSVVGSPILGSSLQAKMRHKLLLEFGEGQEELCSTIEAEGELLTDLWENMQLCAEGDEATYVFFLVEGSVSTVLRLPESRTKELDPRHLNLAKGDSYVEVGQRFRQRKFNHRAVVGVVEVAANLKEYLVTAVAHERTALLRVPIPRLKLLLGSAGSGFTGQSRSPLSATAREALLAWQSAKLVEWIMVENTRVRNLVSLSRASRGN